MANAPLFALLCCLTIGWQSAEAQKPTLTTNNLTLCPGESVNLSSLITTNGTTITWSEKPQAVAIAGGQNHSLALLSNGKVVGWGNNNYQQTTIPNTIVDAKAIAGGESHSLALLGNGTVVGWGSNTEGQTTIPNTVVGAKAIATGDYHSLALLSNGTVVCWGSNGFGQTTIPNTVVGATAIAGGTFHSLALLSNNTVVGWGVNNSGQTTIPNTVTGATAIAAGEFHSLALLGNGTVVGWGQNTNGQTTIPNTVVGVKAIAAGGYHNLALLNDGTVVGWGLSTNGRTMIPNTAMGATAIAAGYSHSLALLPNGSVVGWGFNSWGQAAGYNALPLSNTSVSPTTTKTYYVVVRDANGNKSTGEVTVTVSTLRLATPSVTNPSTPNGTDGRISVGALDGTKPYTYVRMGSQITNSNGIFTGLSKDNYTIIVTDNRGCTATTMATLTDPPSINTRNTFLCVGTSLDLNSLITIPIGNTVTWSEKPQATAIAAGARHNLALLSNGTVIGWGDNYYEQATTPNTVVGATAIAAGEYHSLVLLNNGTVVGWGRNRDGQATIPNTVVGATAIEAGEAHNLALLNNGSVVGWGYSLGGRTTTPNTVVGAAAIAAGTEHSLALLNDGTVIGWGSNSDGQKNAPNTVVNAKAIAGGGSHNLALLGNGTVVGWGMDLFGQTTTPNTVVGATAIAAGEYHSLALLNNGTVVGWGRNQNGQVTIPNTVVGVLAIKAGKRHNIALLGNGSVVGWGDNIDGQANGYDALPLSNTSVSPNATKTYYLVVRDANGNKTTGEVTVTITYPSITTNNALSFDGVNDCVDIQNPTNTPIVGTNALTIEYWFKGANPQSAVRLQSDANNYIVSGLSGQHILSNDGGVGNGLDMGDAAADGNWHHIAMTWQRNTANGFKSYLDGKLVAQRTSSDSPLPSLTTGLFLGSFNNQNEFTDGQLDEVRIWSVVRSQTEIQNNRLGCTNLSAAAGLVVYYQFNHGSAGGGNRCIGSVTNSADANKFIGILKNFSKTGSNSNWLASPLCTDIYKWTGAISTDWEDVSNWSPTIIPTNTSSIEISTTTRKLTLMANQTINQLSFSGNGKLFLDNFNLVVNQINMGSPTAYVVTNATGNLTIKNIGTTATLFPVGISETVYAPATITNNVNRDFTVKARSSITNGATLPNSVNAQWDITPSVSTGNSATLALGWASASQLTGFNPNNGVYIAHNNGTTWDNFHSATVSGSNPYTATATGITNFSPFIVTNQMALPVELLSFKGQNIEVRNPATGGTEGGNFLTWTTAEEKNVQNFEIERSRDGRFFEKIGSVKSKGSNSTYEYLDQTPPSGVGGLYYRLKINDLDEKFDFSKTIFLQSKGKSSIKKYPLIATDFLAIEGATSVQIINAAGHTVLSQKTNDHSDLDISHLSTGLYIVKGADTEGGIFSQKIVKQ